MADNDSVPTPDEIEQARKPTMTELDRAETDRPADAGLAEELPDVIPLGAPSEGLREGETDDPDVAAEEGLTWVPPTDPPIVPSPHAPDGFEIGAGLATSALDEPHNEDHHAELLPDEDELTDRVREAIRADATTAAYADRIQVDTVGSTAVLRGAVDDIDDADSLVAVVERVAGIRRVRDKTVLAG